MGRDYHLQSIENLSSSSQSVGIGARRTLAGGAIRVGKHERNPVDRGQLISESRLRFQAHMRNGAANERCLEFAVRYVAGEPGRLRRRNHGVSFTVDEQY